jgi:signal transduction histidine kinase
MKILIVDDNDINRKLLRVNLEEEGIETFEAADGIQALDRLETEKANAIISDILMPRMDGYRLCREVRKCDWLAATPFIFYTATYTSPGDEKLALACGADRYIKKPAPLSVILMALLELCDPNWRRERQPPPQEELQVMREYNETLVRKLEERNAKLETARAEIMQVNEGLEKRVQERTAELMALVQELEAFSHSIAHDLRSPLMAIDGMSQILLRECEGRVTKEAMDHVGYISQAVRRMNELTTDLLRLSRASRAEMRHETVDLSRLARSVIEDLRKAQPDRRVKAMVADGMTAEGDVALLRIALENLLSNAWKFTGMEVEPEVEVGMQCEGPDQFFYVRDNGAGFDMKEAGRLFNPFQRLHTDSQFSGTGIGLTTVQRIIRRHGGDIRAEGKEGDGAAFFFDLGQPKDKHQLAPAEQRSAT